MPGMIPWAFKVAWDACLGSYVLPLIFYIFSIDSFTISCDSEVLEQRVISWELLSFKGGRWRKYIVYRSVIDTWFNSAFEKWHWMLSKSWKGVSLAMLRVWSLVTWVYWVRILPIGCSRQTNRAFWGGGWIDTVDLLHCTVGWISRLTCRRGILIRSLQG